MLKQLFDAIRQNDIPGVDKLLAAHPELLSQRDESGTSPLSYAAYVENKPLMEYLQHARGTPDFFEAAIVGDLAVIRESLAAGKNLNETAPDGFTALGLAVFFRQPAAARLLIEAGADVNAKATNAFQVGPVHAAVAREDIATLELLLHRGADPNASQQKQFRPLHGAASTGNTPLVALLLMFGADPALATEDGKTPAAYAREKNHVDLARRLDALCNAQKA